MTGALVTCENHQVRNGLGSAVSEVLTDVGLHRSVASEIQDEFGEVGTQHYLQERFGLTADNIVAEAKRVMERKKRQGEKGHGGKNANSDRER